MKKPRARTERRRAARALTKVVQDREALVRLEPGGAPERPLAVETPSVIEGMARSTPCHQCGGAPELLEHAAVRHGEALLRVVRSRCRACHAPRELWFRVARAVH